MNRDIAALTAAELTDLVITLDRQRKQLLDALIIALPYVETATLDAGYKPDAVERVVAQIRAAINDAGGAK